MSNSRDQLLDAAIAVIREKGYAATRVDDIAAKASLTKGSFFHHFPTKEACARAAAARWTEFVEAAFVASGHRTAPTPAERVLSYIDIRIALLEGPLNGYTCYAGTILQEVYETHPDLAADCATFILNHAKTLEADLAAALGSEADEAWGLAMHIQAVMQGSVLIAKAERSNRGAIASVRHLRRYLEARLKHNSE